MADGNDSHGLVTLNGEQTLHGFNIIITYPAGAESAVRGSETKMLHGNAEVDVTMRLAVIRAHPTAVYILDTQHIQRCRLEPVAVVALPDLLFRIVRGEKKKLPWLAVTS